MSFGAVDLRWFASFTDVVMLIQLFKKEEQNFVFANEIDNMALIMPSQDKKTAGEQSDAAARKPKGKTRMGITQSLNVACLRRSVSAASLTRC